MGSRVILSDLSGAFESGSLTAVIGANGSGKTTLLRAIAGLHPLASGPDRSHGFAAIGNRAAGSGQPSGSLISHHLPRCGRVGGNPVGSVSLDRQGSACGNRRRFGACRTGGDGNASDPGAVGGSVPAGAVRPDDRAGRAADFAGRTIHRRRCRHGEAAAVGDRRLAHRGPHGHRGAARYDCRAAAFSSYAAAGRLGRPMGFTTGRQSGPGLQAA